MGYSETSKAYRIYVPGQREVEICHNVTFNEDVALKKVRNRPSSKENKEDEEAGKLEDPKDDLMPDVEGPMDPIDPPPSNKRRPSWLWDTLADAERHVAPRGTFHESKKSKRYQGYLAAMSIIVQPEPGSFEEGGSIRSIGPSTSGIGSSFGSSCLLASSSSSLSSFELGRFLTFLRATSSSKVTLWHISTSL